MSSEAQLQANRANSQLSTGPKTPDGKAKSSLNAVKTGLTGRTVLLPGDDAEAYKKHLQRFFDEHKPIGDAENNFVQSLADTDWRLLRIPALEMGIYALGRLEFADKFAAIEDEAARAALIETQTFLAYQRQLNNLSIQEARLRRQREKDLANLKELQTRRESKRSSKMAQAIQLCYQADCEGKSFDPAVFGFEFSIEQIRERMAMNRWVSRGYDPEIAAIKARLAA